MLRHVDWYIVQDVSKGRVALHFHGLLDTVDNVSVVLWTLSWELPDGFVTLVY